MSHHEDPFRLEALEAQLAALRPAPSGVDASALLFAAGRAAGLQEALHGRAAAQSRAATWFWPLATAASLLVALTFASLWWSDAVAPPPPVAQIPVASEAAPAIEDVAADFAWRELPAESYLHLRQVALDQGVDALPRSETESESAVPPSLPAFRLLLPRGES